MTAPAVLTQLIDFYMCMCTVKLYTKRHKKRHSLLADTLPDGISNALLLLLLLRLLVSRSNHAATSAPICNDGPAALPWQVPTAAIRSPCHCAWICGVAEEHAVKQGFVLKLAGLSEGPNLYTRTVPSCCFDGY